MNPNFKIYVITSSDIKRFIIMEMVIGSITYSVAMHFLHNAILAGIGSWAGTEGIKKLRILMPL
ncbi:hypothetical protein D3C74_52890 [compost metagenome]